MTRWWIGRGGLVVVWTVAAAILTVLVPVASHDLAAVGRPTECPDVIVASCADISGLYVRFPFVGSVEVEGVARASAVGSGLMAALVLSWFLLTLRKDPGRLMRAAAPGGGWLVAALRLGCLISALGVALLALESGVWLWSAWRWRSVGALGLEGDLHTMDQLAVVLGFASVAHLACVGQLWRAGGSTPPPTSS